MIKTIIPKRLSPIAFITLFVLTALLGSFTGAKPSYGMTKSGENIATAETSRQAAPEHSTPPREKISKNGAPTLFRTESHAATLVYLGALLSIVLIQLLLLLYYNSSLHLYTFFGLLFFSLLILIESLTQYTTLAARLSPIASVLATFFIALAIQTKSTFKNNREGRAIQRKYIVILGLIAIWVLIAATLGSIPQYLYILSIALFPVSITIGVIFSKPGRQKNGNLLDNTILPAMLVALGYAAIIADLAWQTFPLAIYLFYTLTFLGALFFMLQNTGNLAGAIEFSEKIDSHFNLLKILTIRNRSYPNVTLQSLHTLYPLFQRHEKKSKETIEHLNSIYEFLGRKTLNREIGFHEEWRFTESFVKLMKEHMGEMLDLTLTFNRRVDNYMVPPMTLLLIVENCFQNLDKMKKKLEIGITIRPQAEGAIVIITDNNQTLKRSDNREAVDLVKDRLEGIYRVVQVERSYQKGEGAKVILSFVKPYSRRLFPLADLGGRLQQWLAGEPSR